MDEQKAATVMVSLVVLPVHSSCGRMSAVHGLSCLTPIFRQMLRRRRLGHSRLPHCSILGEQLGK